MVDPCYAEHPYDVEDHAHGESDPAEAAPKNQETSKMDTPERCLLDDVHGMKGGAACIHATEFLRESCLKMSRMPSRREGTYL
jgi:hypothetical protein